MTSPVSIEPSTTAPAIESPAAHDVVEMLAERLALQPGPSQGQTSEEPTAMGEKPPPRYLEVIDRLRSLGALSDTGAGLMSTDEWASLMNASVSVK
jgi:hypothetical protein